VLSDRQALEHINKNGKSMPFVTELTWVLSLDTILQVPRTDSLRSAAVLSTDLPPDAREWWALGRPTRYFRVSLLVKVLSDGQSLEHINKNGKTMPFVTELT
jgi:hypothetical protein